MNKVIGVFLILVSCISTTVFAGGSHDWEYSGNKGPQHWGELSSNFSACSSGKNQSPINLSGFIEGALAPIEFSYVQGGIEVLNNGHTVQINYKPSSFISVKGHSFELKQFHFHAPSENHINGKSFPIEAHFVHADKKGNLAVIGVMFKEGGLNLELGYTWNQLPMHAGDKNPLKTQASATALLPVSKNSRVMTRTGGDF